MKSLLIKDGYVVNPGTKFEGIADIFIEDGRIRQLGEKLEVKAERTICAKGMTVMPGLIDLHVHLRDPGQEYKEDIVSGSEAAAHGGVTALLAMPNTHPAMDSISRIAYVVNKARTDSRIRIFQASAITRNMMGEELVDIEALVKSGVKAFSEDGKSVMSAGLLREAMKKTAAAGVPIMAHCEDITMVRGGVMNEDENAERLGLPGIPAAAEEVIVARDCVLAADTGAQLHLCHCSAAPSVEIIRSAKKAGLKISAEACPHHFILTSDDIPGDRAEYKVNPPLRTRGDVEAIVKALQDGTIDCISTDHAPHSQDEKNRGFRNAPFGISGIETSAALTYTELVRPGILTLMQMAEKMSYNPANILHIEGGTLNPGVPADLAIFDFNESYQINPCEFLSKGKNTPFRDRKVFGKVQYTIKDGNIIWGKRA